VPMLIKTMAAPQAMTRPVLVLLFWFFFIIDFR